MMAIMITITIASKHKQQEKTTTTKNGMTSLQAKQILMTNLYANPSPPNRKGASGLTTWRAEASLWRLQHSACSEEI